MNSLRQHVSRTHRSRRLKKKKRHRIHTIHHLPNHQTAPTLTNNPSGPDTGRQTHKEGGWTRAQDSIQGAADQRAIQNRTTGHQKQPLHQVKSCITKVAGFKCGFCGRPFWHKNDLTAHQRNGCRSNPFNNPANSVIRYAAGGGATVQPHYLSNSQTNLQVRWSNSLPNTSNVPCHTLERTKRRSSQPSELEGENDIEILWSSQSIIA